MGEDAPRPPSQLEAYLRRELQKREILLMTHIVIGYPDFDTSLRLVDTMVSAGVELMELQIPFSEPIADGPVILQANRRAIAHGATVIRCFELAGEVARRFPIPFLFMSYYNVVFRWGVPKFVARMRDGGLRGMIVPDLPLEEAGEYLQAMQEKTLDPVFIFAPNTPSLRMKAIAAAGSGFVYCVARKGVTGSNTEFSNDLSSYLARARAATRLPLAVGFGVRRREDVDFLRGKADVAVVGSEPMRAFERDGVSGVEKVLASLR